MTTLCKYRLARYVNESCASPTSQQSHRCFARDVFELRLSARRHNWLADTLTCRLAPPSPYPGPYSYSLTP